MCIFFFIFQVARLEKIGYSALALVIESERLENTVRFGTKNGIEVMEENNIIEKFQLRIRGSGR